MCVVDSPAMTDEDLRPLLNDEQWRAAVAPDGPLLILAAAAGTSLASWGRSWIGAQLSQRLVSRLRGELFGKIVSLPSKPS